MKSILLALAFLCLASFKYFAAMAENAFVPAAIMYAVMFGAPQLIWLLLLARKPLNDGQLRVATFTVVAFLFSSIFFGSFPGVSRPSWGREGHFEVPAALLVEVSIAVFGVFLFVARGKRRSEGPA